MNGSYTGVGVFLILGVLFVAGTFAASYVLRPHHPHREKLATYECGERPAGAAWIQFRIIFYLVALSFVIFDVEVIYVIPWAIVLGDFKEAGLGLFALGSMGFFLAVLLLGWMWEVRRKAYDWE